jgi:hypothetical protein
MTTDLVKANPRRTLAIFDKATSAPVLGALAIRHKLKDLVPCETTYSVHPALVPTQVERRAALLPHFAAADEAACTLYRALTTRIEHSVAVTMLGHAYAALGIKPKRAMLEAVADLIFADDVAHATGWPMARTPDGERVTPWEPLNATPLTVALGCRMIVGSARFEPKPSEIRQAIIDARTEVRSAASVAEGYRDAVLQLDRILLMNAREQWERPYLSKQYRPLLARVLELHQPSIFDDDEPSDFRKLIWAEQAKLALPPPDTKPPLPIERPRRRRTEGKRKRRGAVEPPKTTEAANE